LDRSSARFDCAPCSPAEQKLRNCDGKGSPAKIFLNGQLHTRCPRATFLSNISARAIVESYFACKNFGDWPAPGGYLKQTAFCIEMFNYISGVVQESDERRARQAEVEANRRRN
jgi:hypothetical protein